MDLNTITDIKELKAMAFDELQKQEVARQNLQLIQQRIAEMESHKDKQPAKK